MKKEQDKNNQDKKTEINTISENKTTETKTVDSKTTEIKKNTKTKKVKFSEEKNQPVKKLPSLLKKEYTQKQLEKKIFKHIYIAEDKKFIETLFTESGKNKRQVPVFSIPSDMMFTKTEISQLKTLSKEIKSQKSRIKWIPLLAVIIFITAVIVTLTLTKNLIAEKAIKSICETTFEAKCDISDIDISFIDSHFKLHGLEIANKNQPMKNLFSVDSIVFDFDMLQLLRAKFVANELAITGVATNTDRKYSGDISAQLQAKIEKKKAKKAKKAEKDTKDSAFMKTISEKSDLALNTLKDSISGSFDQYNPETIIKNINSQLQTPATAKNAEEEVKKIIEQYKALPAKLEVQINELKTTADEISKINLNEIKSNPAKIQPTIETVTNAYNEVLKLKSETDALTTSLKNDFNNTKTITENLQKSIKHDSNLVSTEISKITSLDISDGKQFITGTFDNIAYQVLGKYYPYAKKITDYLLELKNSQKSKDSENKKLTDNKNTEQKKSTISKRSEGRTVTYKNDTVPKFWIKKAAGSGPNFSFSALDISNNMDATGKAATTDITLSISNLVHSAKLTVDTRAKSSSPLILADYNCDKLPLNYSAENFGNIPGIPGIQTNSNLDFLLKIYEDEGFDITGTGNFTDMILSAAPFEPAFASDIYQHTLSNINQMELSATIGYTVSNGINLNLYSDIDKQFISALNKELISQLSSFKEKTEKELISKINEFTGGVLGEINNFEDIRTKLTSYTDYVDSVVKQFEAKKKEAENLLTKTIDDAKNKATDATKKAVDDAAEKAKDAAKQKLKGFLN